jgi:hypothetical protein
MMAVRHLKVVGPGNVKRTVATDAINTSTAVKKYKRGQVGLAFGRLRDHLFPEMCNLADALFQS